MMTTLGEGVTSAKGSLVSTVAGALSAAGSKIKGWWAGLLNPAEVAALPAEAAASAPAVATPEIPTVPRLELAAPVMPNIPALRIHAGAMPEMPRLEIAVPVMPEAAPVPDAPSVPPPPASPRDLSSRTESGQGGKTITVTIGTLNLPNVQDAPGFVEALQAEIAMIEGMA